VINFSSFAPRPIHSPFIRVRTDYKHARAVRVRVCGSAKSRIDRTNDWRNIAPRLRVPTVSSTI